MSWRNSCKPLAVTAKRKCSTLLYRSIGFRKDSTALGERVLLKRKTAISILSSEKSTFCCRQASFRDIAKNCWCDVFFKSRSLAMYCSETFDAVGITVRVVPRDAYCDAFQNDREPGGYYDSNLGTFGDSRLDSCHTSASESG